MSIFSNNLNPGQCSQLSHFQSMKTIKIFMSTFINLKMNIFLDIWETRKTPNVYKLFISSKKLVYTKRLH